MPVLASNMTMGIQNEGGALMEVEGCPHNCCSCRHRRHSHSRRRRSRHRCRRKNLYFFVADFILYDIWY